MKGIGKSLVEIFCGTAVVGFPTSALIETTTLQEGSLAPIGFESAAVRPEESEYEVHFSLSTYGTCPQFKWGRTT